MDTQDEARNRDGAASSGAAANIGGGGSEAHDSAPASDEKTSANANDTAPALRVRPVDLRDYVKFVPSEATNVRVFQTAQLALELWCLEPRATAGPLHYPDKDVTYTVIAGRSWFVTDDGDVGLDPMGAMLVPADVAHGFENRSPDPLIVIAHASPPGEGANADPADTAAAAIHYQREQDGVMRRALSALLGSERKR